MDYGCQAVSRPTVPKPLHMSKLPQYHGKILLFMHFISPLPSGECVFAVRDSRINV